MICHGPTPIERSQWKSHGQITQQGIEETHHLSCITLEYRSPPRVKASHPNFLDINQARTPRSKEYRMLRGHLVVCLFLAIDNSKYACVWNSDALQLTTFACSRLGKSSHRTRRAPTEQQYHHFQKFNPGPSAECVRAATPFTIFFAT